MSTLFINACVRENSRTRRIAEALLDKSVGDIEEVQLWKQNFPKVDAEFLRKRDFLIYEEQYDNEMFDLARQFAEADEIVIAAPFWDLSFPASLKQYIELINVLGVTFVYTEDGIPKGLCRARKLTYITTAGGEFFPEEFGFGYIKALAENFYGIPEVKLIKAVGLDIVGADPESIIMETIDGEKKLGVTQNGKM